MVFLVFGAGIAAVFGLKARPPKSEAPSIATPGQVNGAEAQSKIDEAERALLEAVEDFDVADAKLLELRGNARRAFEELKNLERKAAIKRLLNFLKLWSAHLNTQRHCSDGMVSGVIAKMLGGFARIAPAWPRG